MKNKIKYNNRKKNNYIFLKEDILKDIFQIKDEFNNLTVDNSIGASPKELFKYVEGIEAISNIIKVDVLMLFTGVLYSIRDIVMEEKLDYDNFDIEFEEGVKLKIPFLMKKGMGTPLYYIDIAKHNIKFYERIKEKIKKENIEFNMKDLDYIFSLSDVRRINISQQTFLTGYALGILYKNKKMKFEDFYEILKEEYTPIHKKHNK